MHVILRRQQSNIGQFVYLSVLLVDSHSCEVSPDHDLPVHREETRSSRCESRLPMYIEFRQSFQIWCWRCAHPAQGAIGTARERAIEALTAHGDMPKSGFKSEWVHQWKSMYASTSQASANAFEYFLDNDNTANLITMTTGRQPNYWPGD